MDLVACAVVASDPPAVFIAEDMAALEWVLALRLVAKTESAALDGPRRERIKKALLDEQWGAALAEWIDHTGVAVDVYSAHRIYTRSDLSLAAAELQFSRLFRD